MRAGVHGRVRRSREPDMHPWEDFAESFAAYLDMVSVLDTALHMSVGA